MDLSRRRFLQFLGVAGGAAALTPVAEASSLDGFLGHQRVTPVRLPHLLPIYQDRASFLPATGQVPTSARP
jgi:hypothetical protein